MSVLTGLEILRVAEHTKDPFWDSATPGLVVSPLIPEHVGPNSIDVTLSPHLKIYDRHGNTDGTCRVCEWGNPPFLDMKADHVTHNLTIAEDGLILEPGELYLGSTNEKIGCLNLLPWIDGRSSVGRLGMYIHVTAGRCDSGFGWPNGATITLEIAVVKRLKIYPNVRIGQVTFFTLQGETQAYSGKYKNQSGPTPSMLWKDFLPKEEGK